MPNSNEYTALIAGYHTQKPKFQEWIYTLTEPFNVAKKRLAQMIDAFDLSQAVGDQLDAIGARVGISRTLPVKLTNVYFALDDFEGIGLDLGVWKERFAPSDGLVTLGDEMYRAVIRAKIQINHWDGQMGSMHDFLNSVFAGFDVQGFLMDLGDMHVVVGLTRATTPPVIWELITRQIIDIIAAGVGVKFVDNTPFFGLDYNTDGVRGLDGGYWFPNV